MNWKNILSRAAWTFVQGALAAVVVVPAVSDLEGWKALAAAAVAGGIAALVSFIKTTITETLSPTV
jgi:hypothetical protein